MSNQSLIQSNTDFIDSTNRYYVNSYTLNEERLVELAAHGIALRKRLMEALNRIRELTAALESANTQETE